MGKLDILQVGSRSRTEGGISEVMNMDYEKGTFSHCLWSCQKCKTNKQKILEQDHTNSLFRSIQNTLTSAVSAKRACAHVATVAGL